MAHITQEFESGPLRGNSVGVTPTAKYEKKTATVKDHVLTAEELKTGWLFPLNPDHQSHSIDCHSPPLTPVIQTLTRPYGETGLQLAQNCPNYPGTHITKVWITDKPPYVP
jgi:hypothetical protein